MKIEAGNTTPKMGPENLAVKNIPPLRYNQPSPDQLQVREGLKPSLTKEIKAPKKEENFNFQRKTTELLAAADKLNKLATFFDYDYRFKIHEATEKVMMLIIDPTKHPEKVIKEIPEEKFLDLLARIKQTVGMLIDEYV